MAGKTQDLQFLRKQCSFHALQDTSQDPIESEWQSNGKKELYTVCISKDWCVNNRMFWLKFAVRKKQETDTAKNSSKFSSHLSKCHDAGIRRASRAVKQREK